MALINNLPSEIKTYLESTRMILPSNKNDKINKTSKLLYKSLFQYIELVAKAYRTDVHLSVIYTDSLKNIIVVFSRYTRDSFYYKKKWKTGNLQGVIRRYL